MGSGRVENKLLFYGFILVALIMVANVSVTETFAKVINQSITDVHSRLLTNSSLGSRAPTSNGTTATITGTILYNDLPIFHYTTAPADLWLWDIDRSIYPSINSTYTTSTGIYSISGVPPGNYAITLFIDSAEPSGTYPGDFFSVSPLISVADGQSSVFKDITAQKLLHITSPIDNSAILGHWANDTWDTYLKDKVSFNWDSLQEASVYNVTIYEYLLPDRSISTALQTQISTLSLEPDLPVSQNNTFYSFELNAFNWAGTLVGQIDLPYDNHYVGAYMFSLSADRANVTVPFGENRTFSPTSDLRLTFDNVTSIGRATVQDTSTPPAPILQNQLGQCSDVGVTANYSGNVTIQLAYDDTNMTPDQESTLQMMQYASIPGDVVNYGQVNILDIAFMAARFGATPASPNWNAAADVTGSQYLVPDGKIDIRDLSVCAVNFGKTSQWTSITTHVDTENNLVYGETSHFSIIGIH
jgi:hypothetical protein